MAYSDVIQKIQVTEHVQHGNSNNAAQIYVYDVHVLLVHSRVIGTEGAVSCKHILRFVDRDGTHIQYHESHYKLGSKRKQKIIH